MAKSSTEMKKFDWVQAVSILANVGVIAGIIFLAIEVRQNQTSLEEGNAINRVSASTSALQYFTDFRSLIAADEELSKIWMKGRAGEELSGVEALRYDYVCRNLIWANVTLYARFSAFGSQREAAATVLDTQRNIQTFPGFRACWKGVKAQLSAWGYGGFVSAVESTRTP